MVKEGQVIFELDASDQRVALASAQARVAAARARAATARAQLAEVVLQRDRERRLADTGAIAPATADDLAARAKSLEEQVHAAEADVSAAQAEANALATNLGNTTIRAPIDGTVIAKPLLPGDVVSPGTPMARLADFSSIVVETDVPEARLHLVSKGRTQRDGARRVPRQAMARRGGRGRRRNSTARRRRPRSRCGSSTATQHGAARDGGARVVPRGAARREAAEGAPRKIVPGSAVTERAGSKVVFVVDQGVVHVLP